jgi:hypothetical protein
MPSEQPELIVPAIENLGITEAELQKPVAAKFLHRQCVEMQVEKLRLVAELTEERAGKEQLARLRYETEARRQVLEERLSSLSNRSSISQLIWGAIAVSLSLGIDFLRAYRWTELAFTVVVIAMLGVAVYLVNRTSKVN